MCRIFMRSQKPMIAIAICCAFLVTSCATDPEQSRQQAAGAITGALVGAAVGALTGKDATSALVGAAAGGLIGFAAVKLSQYHAQQVRTVQQEQQIYGLTPITTPLVKIRNSNCNPSRVPRGRHLEFTVDYSVSAPEEIREVAVEESWSVKKENGELLADLAKEQTMRQPGGYQVGGNIEVPSSIQPGKYQIEFKVRTGTSYDVTSSVFEVSG
ncbi:glycine zipper family protein [Desulfosoma sp.]